MPAFVYSTVSSVFYFFWLLVIIQAVMSWIAMTGVGQKSWYQASYRVIGSLIDPIIGPLRRVLPPWGRLDMSPLVGLLLMFVVSQIVLTGLGYAYLSAGSH